MAVTAMAERGGQEQPDRKVPVSPGEDQAEAHVGAAEQQQQDQPARQRVARRSCRGQRADREPESQPAGRRDAQRGDPVDRRDVTGIEVQPLVRTDADQQRGCGGPGEAAAQPRCSRPPSSPASAPNAPQASANATTVRPCGASATGPSHGNFSRRSLSYSPQYPPTVPSGARFQGWSNASIRLYSMPRRSASAVNSRR